jgi:hypothetical protein
LRTTTTPPSSQDALLHGGLLHDAAHRRRQFVHHRPGRARRRDQPAKTLLGQLWHMNKLPVAELRLTALGRKG